MRRLAVVVPADIGQGHLGERLADAVELLEQPEVHPNGSQQVAVGVQLGRLGPTLAAHVVVEGLAERVEEVFAGGEVVVDGAERDPGPFGHVLHGEVEVAAFGHQLRAGVDDGLTSQGQLSCPEIGHARIIK